MVGRRELLGAVLVLGVAAMALATPARGEPAGCPAVWPPRAPASSSPFDPHALLTMRDIGYPDPGIAGRSPLAVSPDGRRVAFFVSQPVLSVNDNCETLVVLDLAIPSAARVLDSGGSGIRLEEVLRGVRRPSGVFDVNIPVWSPDGQSLLYRKRIGGRTQVWRADLEGASPVQLSQADHDVETIAWTRDGGRVLFTIRPGRAEASAARQAEARRGYLYDARVLPHLAAAPQLPDDLPEAIMELPAAGGRARPAAAADVADFARPTPLGTPDLGPVDGPAGWRAGSEPVDGTYFAARQLWARREGGVRVQCPDVCKGSIRAVWWHRGEVMFLKREGWRRETAVIRAWAPRTGAVRTLVSTHQSLSGCTSTARGVVCLAEGSRRPRRIVSLGAGDGGWRELFDPNPAMDRDALPAVERLRWRNNLGLEAWGDLAIPPGTPPAAGWPLVIVQYASEGFLRGGTGDEYPIFPLAARGIAVLSFQAPDRASSLRKDLTGMTAMVAAGHRGWTERRSILDSLTRGLDLVLARGDIDRTRIGISGLSDGSTTARFALINDNRYAAAAISSCCLEPHSMMTHGGIAQANWFRAMGYPAASRSDPEFWLPASLAMNAAKMDTPLLMQLADDEYLQALETFTALREHGKPVEMYVFPGEHHIKWQPAHRAAIYERNLDWFAFWLQDRIDPDPAKAAQYRRWTAMIPPSGAAGSAP